MDEGIPAPPARGGSRTLAELEQLARDTATEQRTSTEIVTDEPPKPVDPDPLGGARSVIPDPATAPIPPEPPETDDHHDDEPAH